MAHAREKFATQVGQNRPFVDGNKRTAFAATYTFLAVNGIRITADAAETHAFITVLYQTNSFAFSKLVAWLRVNTLPE